MRWPYMAACPRVMSRGHHSDCEAPHPTHGRSLSAWAGRKRPPLSFTLSGGRSHRKRSMGWRTTTRPLSRLRVPWAQATRPPHCLLAPPACGFAPTHGISVGGARADLPASGRRDTSPRPHRPKVRCGLTLRPRRATGHLHLGHIARKPDVGSRPSGRGVPPCNAALGTSLETGCGGPTRAAACQRARRLGLISRGRMWAYSTRPRRATRQRRLCHIARRPDVGIRQHATACHQVRRFGRIVRRSDVDLRLRPRRAIRQRRRSHTARRPAVGCTALTGGLP